MKRFIFLVFTLFVITTIPILLRKIVRTDQADNEIANEFKGKKGRQLLLRWRRKLWWLPYMIAVGTFLCLLYIIAFLHPLSAAYTDTVRWSYVLLSLPAVAGLFITLIGTKNRTTRWAIITAIDLYILGLLLQLFGFFSLTDLINDLISRIKSLEVSNGIP